MARVATGNFLHHGELEKIGLRTEMIEMAINDTYRLLDKIDGTLLDAGVFPLSQTVELANLSSMIGNIFAAAIAHQSAGTLVRNGPHKFPDLLGTGANKKVPDIEIKMALENNKPKGHLAKPGQYLTCRYVLCDADGAPRFDKKNRGVVPYIWELRSGFLREEHFNISNTPGDSGKTAVVNADGMEALKVIYVDLERAPNPKNGKVYKNYLALCGKI